MANKGLSLWNEFDRFFDRPFFERRFNSPFFRTLAPAEPFQWVPDVDLVERNNTLVTRIDLPGMTKDDVTVEVTDNHLVISGERKKETEETKDNVYRAERSYGSFYRTVPLPAGVKVEDIKAEFTNGVLEVVMPLPAKAKPAARQIPIGEARPAKEEAKPAMEAVGAGAK